MKCRFLIKIDDLDLDCKLLNCKCFYTDDFDKCKYFEKGVEYKPIQTKLK